jgi:putative salt-induced outer membrane protein
VFLKPLFMLVKVMKSTYVGGGLLLACVYAGLVQAEDSADPGVWHGDIELGFVNTSGNTQTQTINAKAKAQVERNSWRHTAVYESLNSTDKGKTIAERYVLNGQSDYKFSQYNYMFMMVNYEADRFSGYNYRFSEAIGYGRRIIDKSALSLDIEAGPGGRQSQLTSGGSERELTLRGAVKLAWVISHTSNFSEDLSTEIAQGGTITRSVTALTTQINASLATKITYTVKNTSSVPVGVVKTDTEAAVTLVYSFK